MIKINHRNNDGKRNKKRLWMAAAAAAATADLCRWKSACLYPLISDGLIH